ncbi:hypothetical protein Trydic_g14299 [Trypoxylus dichotomus]
MGTKRINSQRRGINTVEEGKTTSRSSSLEFRTATVFSVNNAAALNGQLVIVWTTTGAAGNRLAPEDEDCDFVKRREESGSYQDTTHTQDSEMLPTIKTADDYTNDTLYESDTAVDGSAIVPSPLRRRDSDCRRPPRQRRIRREIARVNITIKGGGDRVDGWRYRYSL